MTPEARDAFVAQPLTAVLSTIDARGRIHAVPVWYRYVDGVFRIITARDSVKMRNLTLLPRASLCMDEREGRITYATAEGPVEFAGDVSREERLALHAHYRGAETAERIVAKGGHETMLLLLLRPERWITSG